MAALLRPRGPAVLPAECDMKALEGCAGRSDRIPRAIRALFHTGSITSGHRIIQDGRCGGCGRRVAQMRAAALLLVVLAALLPGATLAAPTKQPPKPPKRPGKPPRRPPRSPRPPSPAAKLKPNFVVILTDDQDEVLNSTHPAYMPALNALVGSRGTRFVNTLASTSVCCPARVSLLTGRYAHCTNVTANWAPAGAWSKFMSQRLDSDWLPGWLKEAGYRTMLLGKLFNGFSVPLPSRMRCPLGLDVLEATVLGTYWFFNTSFSLNCGPRVDYPGQYQTDLIRDKALSYIDDALDRGSEPFYLHLTPTAPHIDNSGGFWKPPPPAPRHAKLYPELRLPSNPTFLNPNPLNPSRLINMSDSANVKAKDALYAGRLRSLRAVDEMVQAIVDKLEARGVLNNTYIIYASDNGYHIGQHGLDDGKATMLEEDSRVPLYIAGPGVPRGVVSPYQANLVDIPATIRTLAGLGVRSDLDGLPLPMEGLTMDAYAKAMSAAAAVTAARVAPAPPPQPPSPPRGKRRPPPQPPGPPTNARAAWFRESVILEAWDSDAKNGAFRNITFKSLRLCSSVALNATTGPPALMVPRPDNTSAPMFCLKYNVWCRDNSRELYDLSQDPYEERSVLAAAPAGLLQRLDAVLSVLVHCRGVDCAHPWGTLHPSGEVVTFAQAMHPQFDPYYAGLPRFRFETCYPQYVTENERTFTLGRPGFPSNASWASVGIVWPLPPGVKGLKAPGGGED